LLPLNSYNGKVWIIFYIRERIVKIELRKFLLYGHGGSYNHGAEAIIRTTVWLIRRKYPDTYIILSCHFPGQDKEFALPVDELLAPDPELWEHEKKTVGYQEKYSLAEKMYAEALSYIDADTVCLAIGGDNYCYPAWHRQAVFHNTALRKKARSILWSCSVELSMIDDKMLEVFAGHHLISARESITYNVLRNKGLNNVAQCADIAFSLEGEPVSLPESFQNMVALNISPLVIRRETVPGITIKACRHFIRYILKNTDMGIALIPHVSLVMDNDGDAIDAVLDGLPEDPRMYRVPENLSAANYKYIISKCRFAVLARTHAAIAAYSSCIPVLAIGYSSKAAGIAADLGVSDYVLSIDAIVAEDTITKLFERLVVNENAVRTSLKHIMPQYREKAFAGLDNL
jgi:polysaccharide pyruvyl transferase WcaK-like protein